MYKMEENILCCWLPFNLYCDVSICSQRCFCLLLYNNWFWYFWVITWCPVYYPHPEEKPVEIHSNVGCVCKLSPYISLSFPSRCSQTPVTCRGTSALSTWGLELTPAPTAARPSPPPRALNNTNTFTLPSSPSYVSHSDPSYVSLHAFYSEHHTAELESSSILLKFLTNFESLILNSR